MQKIAGGKRKVNKSLKAWVAFVKKVQREEKLSYKEAIHRAKQRKDKGEKWMKGGGEEGATGSDEEEIAEETIDVEGMAGSETPMEETVTAEEIEEEPADMTGGRRRRRRTRRHRRSMRHRSRTARRSRSRRRY
jgi:hypothetical protein